VVTTETLKSAEARSDIKRDEVDPVSDAESVERAQGDFARRQEWFAAEPQDRAWASTKERALDEMMGALQARIGGFEFDHVECKTSQCSATVRWSGGDEAHAGGRELAFANAGSCSTHVRSAPGAYPDSGRVSEVQFDCTKERAASVE